jgi:hypothetical protein
MVDRSSDVPKRAVIDIDTDIARKLAALSQACAAQTAAFGEAAPGQNELLTTALRRGVQELYETHVRDTDFDLRQRRSHERRRKPHRGLTVV